MRSRSIIIVLLLANFTTFSQVALLDRVYDMIQRRDFTRASEALRRAEKHITTAHDPRTFYLKAFVNKEMLLEAKSEAEKSELRDVMLGSLERSLELDVDRNFQKPLEELTDFAAAGLFNDAGQHFNNKKFVEAIKLYKKYCTTTRDKDDHWLEAKYFIGSAYQSLQAKDSAMVYFEFARKRNYPQPHLYVDLAYVYMERNQMDVAAAVIEQAMSMFPDFYDLDVAYINILIKSEAYDTLVYTVEKFLRKYPDNIEVLLVAGSVYEHNRDEANWFDYYEKAEKAYERVLTLEPSNFDANYNIGVLYYNEAVEIINKTDFDTDIDELTKVLERSTGLFERALPHLQNILTQQQENPKLLSALQAIYYNLNMRDELSEVNNLIKAGKT